MTQINVVRKAAWVVAWDESRQDHRYLKNADVAFAEDRIVHVGGHYEGPVDHEISASRHYASWPSATCSGAAASAIATRERTWSKATRWPVS